MHIDLEIALVDADAEDAKKILHKLPAGFYTEDRSQQGWGLVIRTKGELPNDFDRAVAAFLEPLEPLSQTIRAHDAILRGGVFFDTATCTVRISSLDLVTAFRLALEISAYPSIDESM